MFVDKVKVSVRAGSGGDGIVSFRHEIYIAKGGPDGGDGGKGGDVLLIASSNEDTLSKFRYNKLLQAEDGHKGGPAKKRGRSGEDLTVKVPVGTTVYDDADKIICDLTEDGQQAVVAIGGNGGFGNAHFISSTRQAPKVAEKGEQGQSFDLTFELRIVADVGLIGLPNAGKSSLLSAISNAKPEVADYPFTTLSPHLGVVDINNKALLFADIPGLIEGASQGKGLGDEFLRHVSRCSVLLHLIDINSNDISSDYQTIRKEISQYSKDLANKPEIIALTKIETLPKDLVDMQKQLLTDSMSSNSKVFLISSYAKKGLRELLNNVFQTVKLHAENTKSTSSLDDVPVITINKSDEDDNEWKVEKVEDGYLVSGNKIEKFAERTDFSNEFGVQRLRDILKKMGIIKQLTRLGIDSGEYIYIGDPPIGRIQY